MKSASLSFDALQKPGNVTYGTQRRSADLPDPLGNSIRHREHLIRLLIEQNMIVSEVLA
jgi:hypothetical protein